MAAKRSTSNTRTLLLSAILLLVPAADAAAAQCRVLQWRTLADGSVLMSSDGVTFEPESPPALPVVASFDVRHQSYLVSRPDGKKVWVRPEDILGCENLESVCITKNSDAGRNLAVRKEPCELGAVPGIR
jgi:hypothetical protein